MKRYLPLFLILFFTYAYFFPRWASWSQNSRLDLTMALVDEGSLQIDHYYTNTGDYAAFEGHFYTDKAPGVSFLGVPAYAAYKAVAALPPVTRLMERVASSPAFEDTLNPEGTGLAVDKLYFMGALYTVTLAVITLPAALLGVLLYVFLGRTLSSEALRLGTVLLYALATPAFAYGGMLFSHQLTAFLLFAAFFWIAETSQRESAAFPLFGAGFLAGWAVISEYPAVLIAAGIGVYALWLRRTWKTALYLGLGALLPALLLMGYDYAIFHTILPVGYKYSVNYHNLHDQGLISLVGPNFPALWGITFGKLRGLFFLSPVLLLSLPGFVWWCRTGEERPECFLSLWAAGSFLLFNGSSIMWQGGYAVGPRYLLPMLPFLMLGVARGLQRVCQRREGCLMTAALSAWSLFAVWTETLGGQSFPDWTPNPLFDYSLPYWREGNIARNLGMALGLKGILSLLPVAAVLGAGIGYQMRGIGRRAAGSRYPLAGIGEWAQRGGYGAQASLFFLLGVVTRLPFRSQILHHWDSINFALALQRFDITLHQPHPPGTFMLYLGLGKLFTLFTPDENAALVWLGVFLSGLGLMGMYLLAARLFGRRVGLLTGALSLTSPLVWFHGEVALSYILEFAWVPLVVYAVFRMESRSPRWLLAASFLLGLSGGVRPNTPVFLFPLWAWAVWRNRYSWRQFFLLGVLPGALGALIWFVPMTALTGGLGKYLEVMRWWQAQHTAQSGQLTSIAEQSIRIGIYLFYALTAGVGVLFWGAWKFIRRLPGLLRGEWRAQVLAGWLLPGLLYLSLIHIRQPGHIFTVLPGMILLTAISAEALAAARPRLRLALGTTLLLANLAFFLFAPPYLFGIRRTLLNTPSAASIRQYDAYVLPRLEAIRSNFDPASTAILANGRNFRLPAYYLPEYQMPGLSARFDVGQALTELPPPVHTLVFFDRDVIPPLDENLPTAALFLPDGEALVYLHWPPGETLVISPAGARLKTGGETGK